MDMESHDRIIGKIRKLIEEHASGEEREELKRGLEYIISIADEDPLTGLYNRRYMDGALKREIARSYRNRKPLSFGIIDIDFFKRINDERGHQEGDRILKEFAKLMKERLRGSDIVCRYGGEEFGTILPETESSKAYDVIDGLRERAKREIDVTFSAGISSNDVGVPLLLGKRGRRLVKGILNYGADIVKEDVEKYAELSGRDPEHVEEMLKNIYRFIGNKEMVDIDRDYDELASGLVIECADRALYKAKEEGRNRVLVYSVNI